VERRGFEPRTSQRCVREYLAFAKKFEAKAPVWKTSAGKLEEAVAAFSAALEELTQASRGHDCRALKACYRPEAVSPPESERRARLKAFLHLPKVCFGVQN
jgi:hypothetical protein